MAVAVAVPAVAGCRPERLPARSSWPPWRATPWARRTRIKSCQPGSRPA